MHSHETPRLADNWLCLLYHLRVVRFWRGSDRVFEVIGLVFNNISGFLITSSKSITSQGRRQIVGGLSFVFINIPGATSIFHVEDLRQPSGTETKLLTIILASPGRNLAAGDRQTPFIEGFLNHTAIMLVL